MTYLRRNGDELGGVKEKNITIANKQEYIHRFYNDGKCVTRDEYWNLRVEYHKYKEWADQIQDKALNTLKYTVNKLLLDFENNAEVKNEVISFNSGKAEKKRNALNRLLSLLN